MALAISYEKDEVVDETRRMDGESLFKFAHFLSKPYRFIASVLRYLPEIWDALAPQC